MTWRPKTIQFWLSKVELTNSQNKRLKNIVLAKNNQNLAKLDSGLDESPAVMVGETTTTTTR